MARLFVTRCDPRLEAVVGSRAVSRPVVRAHLLPRQHRQTELKVMKIAAFVVGLAIALPYGLNRGIFVGSERLVWGPRDCSHMADLPPTSFSGRTLDGTFKVVPAEKPECTDYGSIQRFCRYLFVTGVSRIPAFGETVYVAHASDRAEILKALEKPDNSYCRFFAR
jgi:hypothetical protein